MRPVTGVPGVDFTVEDVRGDFPAELEIEPLAGPVDATVRVPGSKSVTNRALLVAALGDGASTIENCLYSEDSYWLMSALVKLGFDVCASRETGETAVVGQKGIIPRRGVEVFVGNAGTVGRFLPPTLSLGKGPYLVGGTPRMRERPVGNLVDAMRLLGAGVGYADEEGRFPLRVEGGGLRGGKVRVRGKSSSQFVSGLLMAAPYARGPVTLEAEGREEWPYVGITAEVMRAFGVGVEVGDGARYAVEPAQYRAREYGVEPDASGASYFMAAAAVTGGRVRIPGLGAGSPQGDLRFAEVLDEMGCGVEVAEDWVEVRGTERLRGVEVDMNAFSDTMITLAAIAPFASTPTVIKNVGHTRYQETDRISAVAGELGRLGIAVEEGRDRLRITPGSVRPATVETHGDHRMAMAFAVVGLVAPGIRLRNPGCVAKTFPDYFERLDALR
ncbi:MAG: 3-phosphoshikimate 1-carboxyvinyltransferase [Actinomycetota bacterium]|nr:3-phosphoshikimate 1-carboxyvinyltransferase [Actinomycetota bacterium]